MFIRAKELLSFLVFNKMTQGKALKNNNIKSTLFYFFILSVFYLFPFNLCIAVNYEELQNKTLKGQELIFSGDYKSAIKLFKEIQKEYSDSPAGYFGEGAVYEVMMLEDEDFKLSPEADEVIQKGLKVAKKIEAQRNPDLFDLFVSGSIYGLDGFFKARKHEWIEAYVRGVKSRQIFHHVKALDKNFIDADFGDGMYIFWRSVYAKDLWFLKFFPDRRKEGMALIKEVIKKGKYSKDLAEINLGIMHFQMGENIQASRIFEDFALRYPENPLIKLILGKIYLSLRKFDESRKEFEMALKIRPNLKKPIYFIGLSFVMQNKDLDRALSEFRKFLSTKPDKLWQSYTYYWEGQIFERKKNIEEAKKCYEKAFSLNKKLSGAKFKLKALGGGI